jgi:hypothetical protein
MELKDFLTKSEGGIMNSKAPEPELYEASIDN